MTLFPALNYVFQTITYKTITGAVERDSRTKDLFKTSSCQSMKCATIELVCLSIYIYSHGLSCLIWKKFLHVGKLHNPCNLFHSFILLQYWVDKVFSVIVLIAQIFPFGISYPSRLD